MSNGWSNAETWKVWTVLSNDSDLYPIIIKKVNDVYVRHISCGIFSRRLKASSELAHFVMVIFRKEYNKDGWYSTMPMWAKELLLHSFNKINWEEMSEALIEIHEFSHNIKSRL